MLLQEFTNENLESYLEKLAIFPNLLTIYHSIDTEHKELFPCAKHFAFEGKCRNEEIYFVYRENIYVMPFLFIASTATSIEATEELEEIFLHLITIFPKINNATNFMTIGAASLTRRFNIWYSKYLNKEKFVEYPTYLYYMTGEQQQLAQNFIPSFPDGYYYDNNISDSDSFIINNTWQHAKEGDLEQTRAKLKHLPFACIKNNDKPVSFEMTDPSGFLNHQFTIEEHRRKGLGLAIEIEISKKISNLNRVPYKTVELYNVDVIKNSNNSPYWTRWDDQNGNPVEFLFIRIYKD